MNQVRIIWQAFDFCRPGAKEEEEQNNDERFLTIVIEGIHSFPELFAEWGKSKKKKTEGAC